MTTATAWWILPYLDAESLAKTFPILLGRNNGGGVYFPVLVVLESGLSNSMQTDIVKGMGMRSLVAKCYI